MGSPSWVIKLPRELIKIKAEKYRLDPDLMMAMIWKESRGVPYATKEEVRPTQERYLQDWRDHASRLGITPETERYAQMHSYGLGQLMGWLARSYGFSEHLVRLCEPALNLEYMGLHLQRLFQRWHTESDVVSAFNQGSPRKTAGGMYENQRYVDDVHQYLHELRKI